MRRIVGLDMLTDCSMVDEMPLVAKCESPLC